VQILICSKIEIYFFGKMSQQIIGLVGYAGSGKSTAAELLKKHGWQEMFFAEPLKKIGIAMGFEESEIYGTIQEKEKVNEFFGVSGREFLQKMGTEVFREYVPKIMPGRFADTTETVWCMLMRHRLSKTESNVVISDCRFEDEAKMISELGGKLVRIERNSAVSKFSDHPSEASISRIKCDVVIDNNSTLEDLEQQLLGI
jgi:hypothetical protein